MIITRVILATLILAAPATLFGQSPEPDDEVPAPTKPEKAPSPMRVHIVLDRFREVGGELVKTDDATISIKREGRVETYERNKCLAIVPLIDVKNGGEDGVVFLRDGSMLDALVIADDYDKVLVMIEGIEHELPRDDVAYVRIKPSFEERLSYLRENIREEDLESRIELARWMANNDQLERARQELLAVLAMDDHPEAKQLIKLFDARIELETNATDDPTPLPPKVDRTEGIPKRRLTIEDVNLIRVYEIDFTDPPKVNVMPSTIKAMIEKHGSNRLIPKDSRGRESLFALRDIDQVKLLFDVQARELYPEIQVESEPRSLELFKKSVHNAWLIRNCATSGCHGGNNAGRFYLHRYDTKDPRTVYENLLILERLDLGGPHRLIDYENPSRSLIIQHALPPSESRNPHPDVPGYKPVFPADGGRLQKETEKFIRSMYRPRPQYPVEFEPPTQKEPLRAAPSPRVPR
jgi:hypothetical protein